MLGIVFFDVDDLAIRFVNGLSKHLGSFWFLNAPSFILRLQKRQDLFMLGQQHIQVILWKFSKLPFLINDKFSVPEVVVKESPGFAFSCPRSA